MTQPRTPQLAPRQQKFVEEYLLDLNATQAAIRAGYSARTARQQSARMLTNDNIVQALGVAMADRAARTGIDADRVLAELGRIAFSDLRRAFAEDGTLRSLAAFDDDLSAAISSIKIRRRDTAGGDAAEYVTELKLWDKIDALERLGKHLGLLRERVDVNVTGDLASLIAARRKRVIAR